VSDGSVITTVIDAGGRYGLHPTWKPFGGELHYVLFEPDPSEARRLEVKYRRRDGEVFVEAIALGERTGQLSINFFRNRAMSSSAVRKSVSALFTDERASEVEIVDSLDVTMVTVDDYCSDRGLEADFLKLDTEGSEFDILKGAQQQLAKETLGIRSEVSFERIFEGKALFGALHEFLLDRNFYLLNLDYDGRGEYQNEFVRVDGKYGVLQAADGVWLLRKNELFGRRGSEVQRAARILKYAAFCLNNFASDVAIDVLLDARRAHGIDFRTAGDSRLYKYVDIGVHKLFYDLKWQPGQSLRKNESVYSEIFDKEMKKMNEYMQSEELNPD
jgi:FkbM family methyltransferase